MNSKVDMVGFGKSAWAGIARKLGGIRGLRSQVLLSGGERDITANWIIRKTAPGFVDRNFGNPWNPTLTMRSSVNYASQILSQGDMAEAMAIARSRLTKQAEMAARYEMRRAFQEAA